MKLPHAIAKAFRSQSERNTGITCNCLHEICIYFSFLPCDGFYFLIIIYLLSPIPFTAHSHFMPSNCPLLFLLNFVVIYFLFIFFFIYSNFQREPMFFGKITTHSMEVKRHCKRSYIRQQQLYPLTS